MFTGTVGEGCYIYSYICSYQGQPVCRQAQRACLPAGLPACRPAYRLAGRSALPSSGTISHRMNPIQRRHAGMPDMGIIPSVSRPAPACRHAGLGSTKDETKVKTKFFYCRHVGVGWDSFYDLWCRTKARQICQPNGRQAGRQAGRPEGRPVGPACTQVVLGTYVLISFRFDLPPS